MTYNSQSKKYYANGKLMLTGEYVVLSGAEAIGLPLKKGQELIIQKTSGRSALAWKTFVLGNHWFDAYFSLPEFAIANTTDFPTAQILRDIFMAARELNPGFPDPRFHYEIISKVNFDLNWGFGSSSSLLVNIAQWADIDPFELHFKISKGSGYDIATAKSDVPVLYKLEKGKPYFREVELQAHFLDNIYFGYLGKKRRSAEAVNEYPYGQIEKSGELNKISSISREILKVKLITEFINLLKQHD
ncbi:MAG: GYDIA family GHMP kinase, partial [Bacteroidota bacterium]